MDPITTQDSSGLEEPPMVIPVESPPPRPGRPGPNILMAFVWWLVLLGSQLAIVFVFAILIAIATLVLPNQKVIEATDRGAGWSGPFDAPWVTMVLFSAATGATVLVASLIVVALHR